MLKGVCYSLALNSSESLFVSLKLPCFYSQLLETGFLCPFWSSDFEIGKEAERALKTTARFVIPRIYSHYGKSVGFFYIPTVFNDWLDHIFLSNSKKALKMIYVQNK